MSVERPWSNWEGLGSNWTPMLGVSAIGNALLEEDSTQCFIAEVGVALTHLLLMKNQRYGDSAINPIEVFAKDLTPRQRMAVRMDDKLNRMKNGLGTNGGDGEHPGIDLAGYLVLDIIAEWKDRAENPYRRWS
jgi:hypothetical protein